MVPFNYRSIRSDLINDKHMICSYRVVCSTLASDNKYHGDAIATQPGLLKSKT